MRTLPSLDAGDPVIAPDLDGLPKMDARGSWLARVLIMPIRGYQIFISPALAPTCRYYPSCSAYAVDALRVHGGIKGSWLAVRRIARCHPWHWSGYDPVPPRGVRRSGAERRALAAMAAAGVWSDGPESSGGATGGSAVGAVGGTAGETVGDRAVMGSVDGPGEPLRPFDGSSDGPSIGGAPRPTSYPMIPAEVRQAAAPSPTRSAGATATNAGSSAA